MAGPPVSPTDATVYTPEDAGESRPPRSRLRVALAAVRGAVPAAVVAVVVPALFVAALVAYHDFLRAHEVRTELIAIAERIDALDAELVTVDLAVQAEIASISATDALAAIPRAEDAEAEALAIISALDGISADVTEDLATFAAGLRSGAAARAAMMAEAPPILEADAKAASATIAADAAVAAIHLAQASAAQATVEFNKHTQAGVRDSTRHFSKAAVELAHARSLFETATATFPEADFRAFVTYIDAKYAFVQDSLEISRLWLSGKVAESNTRLVAHNAKEPQLDALAGALPASARDPIANAYESITGDALDRYYAARERARVAGDTVRRMQRVLAISDD